MAIILEELFYFRTDRFEVPSRKRSNIAVGFVVVFVVDSAYADADGDQGLQKTVLRKLDPVAVCVNLIVRDSDLT